MVNSQYHIQGPETYPISANLLPLHLLPRHGQLPPQPLKLPLTQPHKPLIQFLLIIPLHARNLPQHLRRQRRRTRSRTRIAIIRQPDFRDLFGGGETDVAVFVVMDIDVYGAG